MRRRSGCVKTIAPYVVTMSQTKCRRLAPLCVCDCFSLCCIPLHGYAVRTGAKRFSVIWDAACRVKLGRIGPCRRRRWEPFCTPCTCTGVMFIHRRGDGRMLFPTGSGGGNDSCSSRVSRRLMRHGVQPLMLSFHRSAMMQRRKLAKMRSKGSCENFGKFSITLLC